MTKYKYLCNHSFFKEQNEKSFYWAGFIAADGSLIKRKYSKISKICLSIKDIEHLEKFKSNIQSNHPIKIYNNSCEIVIVSNFIYEDLKIFDIIPNKTKIYSMPEWLEQHELYYHFLRGYFDGDGTITSCGLVKNRKIIQKNWSILGTEKFITQYLKFLTKNNLPQAKIRKHSSVFKISCSGNRNIQKIYELLYSNSIIFLDRKLLKFKL